MTHNSYPHLALIEYIDQVASKENWHSDYVKHYGYNHSYGEYHREHDWGSQRLKFVLKGEHISLIKTAKDNYWYDRVDNYYLSDPESLEKIKTYFVH